MSRIKNILFSTTRQWNPGDEFILMGCINLLKSLNIKFNPIIYNRNPDIRKTKDTLDIQLEFFLKNQKINLFESLINKFLKTKKSEVIEDNCVYWDNSFKDYFEDNFIDLAIFAGSPEWIGPRIFKMYNFIDKYNIPSFFFGIGSSQKYDLKACPQPIQNTIKKAKIITVKDQITFETLKEFNPLKLPCPALFAATDQHEKNISTVKKIALIYSDEKSVLMNNVSKESYNFMLSLYKNLINKFENQYEFELICHYIDEIPHAKKDFPDLNVRYSFNSSDYVDMYHEFDFTIGHRIHGIGLSASCGIPGVLISHDLRSETAMGFCASIVSHKDTVEEAKDIIKIEINNASTKNKQILEHKHNTYKIFQDLLKDKINNV